VLGLAAPHVDLEEAGLAVAPLAILLDPLGDGHAQVGHWDAGVGEAELGVLDQVADDGGVVVLAQAARSSYEELQLQQMLRGVEAQDVMAGNLLRIPPDLTLQDAVDDYFMRYDHGAFPVKEQGGRSAC
jgi:hypothetical protein